MDRMTIISKAIHNFFIPNEENHFRPKSLERSAFLAYILIALVLKLGLMSYFSVLPKTIFYADVTRLALVNLTNQTRVAEGLAPLRENTTLEKAAQAKAQDILAKGYFAHQSPDGKTPWYWFLQAGYKYLYAGENLAIDFVESTDVVQAWLASPGHRANIENKNYRDIGIAVVTGKFGGDASGPDRIVVVQLFGNPVVATNNSRSTLAPSKFATTPKPTVGEKPSATPTPGASIPPSASPSSVVGRKLLVSTSLTATSLTVAAFEPTATELVDGAVLGQAQLPLGEPAGQSGTMRKFSAKLMTAAERFAEHIFFAFLAFVILISLLNIVIRPNVQHADLIARTFVLFLFFVALIAVRDQTFLHLTPGVL